MNVSNKKKYRCDSCDAEFYITLKPVCCPICGSKSVFAGSKKSKQTADEYIAELNVIIPRMNELCNSLQDLYSRYMTLNEVLKQYEGRGIIEKDIIPRFKLPSLSKAFYDSRKKGGKQND